MELLTRTEELILLAVYRLDDNAYGTTIREELGQMVDKSYSVGAVYVPLERLTEKGLLDTSTGAPTAQRGGRRKRFYHLTPQGKHALEAVRQLHQALWDGVPRLI